MKATLENFLVKRDGNNPLWKEFMEWMNKGKKSYMRFTGLYNHIYYGFQNKQREAVDEAGINDTPIITLEQWKELINKTNNMKNVFKKGDRVFVYAYGWCEFRYYNHSKAGIKYKEYDYEVPLALISFTEYRLEGFTQERPFEPEIGKFYYYWTQESLETECVGYGKYLGISRDELAPYIFGTKNFPFISDKNPLQ